MTTTEQPGTREVVEVDLDAAPAVVTVAGRAARLLTYNAAFPGPLLRFREGDRVRVRLTNRLGEPTNLHLHGLHIPPDVDDPLRLVDHGDTAAYEFDVAPGSAGLYWYHPHAHGRVAPQLFGGLAGPLVIDGPHEPVPAVDEHVVVLKDLALSGDAVEPHTADDWLNGKEGDLVLVNGLREPRLDAPSGAVRLRLVNACNARYFLLAVEGHTMTVLGAGVGLAEEPTEVDTLLLAPGERADVLVTLRHTEDVGLVALPYDRGHDMSGMDSMASGHGAHGGHHGAGGTLGNDAPVSLATLRATEGAPPPELPARLASLPAHELAGATRRRIVLSEAMGDGPVRFLLNGHAYEHGRIDFRSRRGTAEVWEIVNDADMDHPFHVHVFPFVVLTRDGEPEAVRMWRDTVNLAAGERTEILIPFDDFTGPVMYHCHIVEHEDRGMMGMFEVVPDQT